MGRVCGFGGAVGGEDPDDHVECYEGCPDAAWVERREVWDVIEEAAEDEVVGAVVKGRAAEEEDGAGDVDAEVGVGLGEREIEVVVVPRGGFAQGEASHEERRGPGEEEADAVRAVL